MINKKRRSKDWIKKQSPQSTEVLFNGCHYYTDLNNNVVSFISIFSAQEFILKNQLIGFCPVPLN